MSYHKLIFKILIPCFLIISSPDNLHAQSEKNWYISGGLSIGHMLNMTYGNNKGTATFLGVLGDLEIKRVIGRVQLTYVFPASFDGSTNFESGSGFHGSLGYNLGITDKINLPIFLTGGASLIQYRNGIFGSQGDLFTDVSPQIGVTLSPYYRLTNNVSVQATVRYLKGSKGGDRSRPIDITNISLGLRLTI